MNLHPEDARKLQEMLDWYRSFRGENVRQSGNGAYVSGNPNAPGGINTDWRPQLVRVKSEENDYLVCNPYWALGDSVSDTEIMVAKPHDMRGDTERWGVYPAYVPEVTVLWAAPFRDNNATDNDDEPILLMDMNVDGRSAAGFWAEVGTATANGTNKWTYEVTEQTQTDSGWEDLTNGRVVSAVLNGAEANNSGSGVQGNGVDLDGQIFTDNADLELQKIQGSPVVWVVRTYHTDGTAVYAFSMSNAIDGECA